MITKISLNTHPQTQLQPTFNGTITIKPIVEMSASYMKYRTRTAISYLIKSIPDSEIIGSNYSGVKKFRQKQFIKIKYNKKAKETAKEAVKIINTLKWSTITTEGNYEIKFEDLFIITLKNNFFKRKGK